MGCVHRRLRETSFVLTDESVVKLLDYGCSDVPPPNLFRPPEFADGNPGGDHSRGDTWSLGVLLVIMTTGGMYSFIHMHSQFAIHVPYMHTHNH